MNNKTAIPSGRFKKGASGNPSGRPPGSRNKATLAIEQLLEGQLELVIKNVVEQAIGGNLFASRLILDRAAPVRRDRVIELPLEPTDHPSDPPLSHRGILTAIANSTITPAEGLNISSIVTAHEDSMEREAYWDDEFEPEELLEEESDHDEAPEVTTPKPKTPKVKTLKPKVVAKSIPKPLSQKKFEEQRMEQLEKEFEERREEEITKRINERALRPLGWTDPRGVLR